MTDDPGLVIFDCDGVLVDSERLTVEIERQILSGPGAVLFSDMRELPGLLGAAVVD